MTTAEPTSPPSHESSLRTPLGSVVTLPPCYFVVTFWGDEFLENFLDITLASLLAPRNIPKMRGRESARFLICTNRSTRDALISRRLYHKLESYLKVDFVLFHDDEITEIHKYLLMSRNHNRLLNR